MKTATTGLIVFLAAVSVAAAQAPAAWLSFKSPEGRYTAAFPTPPRLSAQEGVAKTGEKFPQYMASSIEGDLAFIVGYFDVLPNLVFTMAESRDGMLAAVKGVLVSETPISLRGYPGMDLTITAKFDGTDFLIRAKAFQAGRRIYVTQAIFPQTTSATEVLEKSGTFFNGFDITPSPY